MRGTERARPGDRFDDLSEYDSAHPETPWRAERYLDTLGERSRELLTELYLGSPTPNRLMHMVVLAGVARPSMWFDSEPDPVLQTPQVSFYAGDLEAISAAERGDPLTRWRFAVDADRLPHRFFAEDLKKAKPRSQLYPRRRAR